MLKNFTDESTVDEIWEEAKRPYEKEVKRNKKAKSNEEATDFAGNRANSKKGRVQRMKKT